MRSVFARRPGWLAAGSIALAGAALGCILVFVELQRPRRPSAEMAEAGIAAANRPAGPRPAPPSPGLYWPDPGGRSPDRSQFASAISSSNVA